MEHREHVDITGLMSQPKKGWEERTKKLATTDYFKVVIETHPVLLANLTFEEQERLQVKIKLVEEWAEYMAAGMVKGTVKYKTDEYELKTWMAHIIGEGADQANYQILMFDSWRRGVK